MRHMLQPLLACHIAVEQPIPMVSHVVDATTITSYLHKLTLMDDLINQHSKLNPLCRQTAPLSLLADFMNVCHEQKLYTTNAEWIAQNYKVTNKLIESRNGDLALKVADLEHAKQSLAQHVQRCYYRPAFEKLSHNSLMYNAELSNVRDT